MLLAVAALLEQGLLEVGQQVYAKLKNGYYGLSTMLLAYALMYSFGIKELSRGRIARLIPTGTMRLAK